MDKKIHRFNRAILVYTVPSLPSPLELQQDTMIRFTKTTLHGVASTLTLIFSPSLAAQPAAPTAPITIGITEITDSSHPFETLYCARQAVQLRYFGKLAEVVVDGESRILVQALSASGARYVAPGDATTELWGKGALATLTWSGQQLPLCAPGGTIIPPYRASGNEPFWSVSYDGWSATLTRPGEEPITLDAVISDASERGQTLVAGDAADGWTLHAQDGLCIDDMSGMPHPQRVALHFQSQSLQGCGGDPNRLLQGARWTISHVGERPISAAEAPYIRFETDNKVHGNAGCNNFFGTYALTGESLSLSDLANTRKACPTEQMALEKELLSALSSVSGFRFPGPGIGHLILHTDQVEIRATAPSN